MAIPAPETFSLSALQGRIGVETLRILFGHLNGANQLLFVHPARLDPQIFGDFFYFRDVHCAPFSASR